MQSEFDGCLRRLRKLAERPLGCGAGYKDRTTTASLSISWSRALGKPVGGLPRCSAMRHDDLECRFESYLSDHLPEGRTIPAPGSGAGMARLGDAGARVRSLIEALTSIGR